MPKFLDYHEIAPQMSPEAVEHATEVIKSGEVDSFGVRNINNLSGDGHAWCLSEAPDADAVVKAHESWGIALEKNDVTEVQTLA